MIYLDNIDEAPDIFNSQEYKEFCECIEEMMGFDDNELYLEALEDPAVQNKGKIKRVANATGRTTGDVLHVYDDLTDAGGSIIGGVWNVVMKTIGLAAKMLKFITHKSSDAIHGVTHAMKRVGSIPKEALHKIKGDITLNVTAADIETLYNESLLQRLDTYIAMGYELAKGDVWKTFFSQGGDKGGPIHRMNNNDMKRCREMEKIYNLVKNVKFNPTIINMSDERNLNIYFGGADTIKFVDLRGKQHKSSYYDALKTILNDIVVRQDILTIIQRDLGKKYDATQMNQNFAKLDKMSRERVVTTIQMMSKIIAIVGNLMKCIIADMNTIEKSCDVVLAKRGINGQPQKS